MEREPSRNRLYPERPGVGLEEAFTTLQREPEITLSPEAESEARQYEQTLTRGELVDSSGMRVEPIEPLWEKKIRSATMYMEYLQTQAGRKLWQELVGTPLEGESLNELQQEVLRTNYESIPVQVVQQLEKASRAYGEAQVLEQFAASGFTSVEGVSNPTKVTVVRNPQVLVDKIAGLRQLKHYQRTERQKLQQEGGTAVQAKLAMLTIHQRRTNELLVDTYSTAGNVLQQRAAGSPQVTTEMEQAIRSNLHGLAQLGDERAGHFLARLDKFKEGAGQLRAEDHEYTPISVELERMVTNFDESNAMPEPEIAEYALKDVPRAHWENVVVSTAEWNEWARIALGDLRLLSRETDYDRDRHGRTSDELWQVIEDPAATHISVNSAQGVIRTPKGMKRHLASLSPAGAVPVLDHEIAHVIQHENKRRLGLAITEKVGMDRSDLVAEAGAILAETKAQEEIFGQRRPLNLHYLRAMQEKLKGGCFRDCVKVFFESLCQQSSDTDPKENTRLSIDRVTRLFRNGGSFSGHSGHVSNSQPLVYLEQELLEREVRRHRAEVLTMVGGANIFMLAELRRVGMLDLSRLTLPKQRPSQILLPKIRQKILQQ